VTVPGSVPSNGKDELSPPRSAPPRSAPPRSAPPRSAPPRSALRRTGVRIRFAVLAVVLLLVVMAGVAVGPVSIPIGDILRALTGGHTPPGDWAIIYQVRMPRTITATACGAALGVAGLQMQALFRNPLADPFVLGIESGASLGVALIVLAAGNSAAGLFGSGLGFLGDLGSVVAASVGSAAVLVVVMAAGRAVRSSNTLLLIGVMLAYLVSAAITILLAGASPERVQEYVEWEFGSFEGVTWPDLRVMVPVLALGLLAAAAGIKSLNALLLGERYAATMGLHIGRARLAIIATASVLAGTVTAFAGPIYFLGIAIPHLARSLFRSSDHRVVLPASILIGAAMGLAADILAQLPGTGVLPLNAMNAIFGAPVVVLVLLRANRQDLPV
jgi:iron complex transport system permease protein